MKDKAKSNMLVQSLSSIWCLDQKKLTNASKISICTRVNEGIFAAIRSLEKRWIFLQRENNEREKVSFDFKHLSN